MAVSAAIGFDQDEAREMLSFQSDEELYARMQSGDQAALRALFDRHVRAMRKLAMNVLHDAHESEDVTQEVFAALWRNNQAWDVGVAKFSTWLSRVTVNRAIDHRRKLRATPHEPVEIAVLCDAGAAAPIECEDDALDARRLAALVRYMLNGLPQSQRAAMRAYYFEERSVEEIAARMELSQQAVRALLKRAKREIREQLTYDRAGAMRR